MDKRQQLERILKYIPSGAQTLSKNPTQYVVGVTPLQIERANGVYIWDTEGNKYLDMMLALGPMIFGYANSRIAERVKAQIDKGTIYSLPSVEEERLAILLSEVVPCAEMSRFVLNGNDATSGAVRLARHITGRDHIAKCGYHGCQDWSICTKNGRNNGVAEIIKTMTHDFEYNNIESLQKIFEQHDGQIAAVILEPACTDEPLDNFLEKVRDLAHKHGALLIFDEMITGFRWALGGAQEYYGVTPDLACFGKAISGGYPIAAICGKREYMNRMDEVFVSMTFGGYVPSLVAAIETITMMREKGNDVFEHLHTLGKRLIDEANSIARKYELPIELVGYGPHPVMKVTLSDDYMGRLIKSYIYQYMSEHGIIFSSSMMIGYAHTDEHIEEVIVRFGEVCHLLAEMEDMKNDIESQLKGDVIAPRTVRNTQ